MRSVSASLSIIVPAHNVGQYLPACLNSILASTYRDFEILLIDDGSTDNTDKICDQFQRDNMQIKVFHTENRGISSARNLGIENAAGKFIGFVDADDVVSPDMFGALVDAMGGDTQMSICAFRRSNRESLTGIREAEDNRTVRCNQEETASLILKGSAGPYVWNKLYRRDVLNDNNIRFRLDVPVAEDQIFNAEYLRHCSKSSFVERTLYYYVTTEGSVMSTFRTSRTVNRNYVGLPRAWRFTAEIMEGISDELAVWSRSRAAMFYQTVLRKLRNPEDAYIQEAVSYVKQHGNTLLHYKWGIKYYLSALVLCSSYPLWANIFRRGID